MWEILSRTSSPGKKLWERSRMRLREDSALFPRCLVSEVSWISAYFLKILWLTSVKPHSSNRIGWRVPWIQRSSSNAQSMKGVLQIEIKGKRVRIHEMVLAASAAALSGGLTLTWGSCLTGDVYATSGSGFNVSCSSFFFFYNQLPIKTQPGPRSSTGRYRGKT